MKRVKPTYARFLQMRYLQYFFITDSNGLIIMNDCVLNKANGTPPVLDLILPKLKDINHKSII